MPSSPSTIDSQPGASRNQRELSASGPRVTVVMATYNAMPYLPESVESILNQTFNDFQFVIVNDGSTDTSAQYLDSLDDPRLTIIHQENQGQQAAANRAIELVDTEYIARMDGDDVAELDRLEKQVAFLDEHPEVGLVGTQFRYRGERGIGAQSELVLRHDDIYHELINNRHAFCNTTSVFRTKLFDEIGGYWEYNISEDWDFFLRAAEHMKLANLPKPLIQFRLHTGSINGRRMFESQLHNEFACELARRRKKNLPKISFDEFWTDHPYRRFPRSLFFKLDCHSVSLYRLAMVDVVDRRYVKGYGRLLWAMTIAPWRTASRFKRMFVKRCLGK